MRGLLFEQTMAWPRRLGCRVESPHLRLASRPRPFGLRAADRDRTVRLLDTQNMAACPTLVTAIDNSGAACHRPGSNRWEFNVTDQRPQPCPVMDFASEGAR